jgi:sec-independent protein translocase protein TatC
MVDKDNDNQGGMGLLSHLVELRDRLLKMVIAIAVGFAVLFPFANTIYTFVSGPLTRHLPEGSSMIAIDVASPFLTPFKLVLMLSVVLTVPFLLHQLWSFIAPGLYKHEKRLALPLLVSSVLLFYLGMAFAYYVVFPLVFGFFTSVVPDDVAVMTDINRYLDFVIMLFFAFGIAFEVPVATILIVMTGMTTPDKLASMRPYIIVGAFVVGMFLTPPDVISQVLLALPMWLLFEVGLFFSRRITPRKAKEEVDSNDRSTAPVAAGAGSAMDAVEDALINEPRYRPMTDAEMEAELDDIEAEDGDDRSDTSEDTLPKKPKGQ